MHVSKLVVMVAALAAGSAARAQSTVPCDFVDDFCVAPSGSVACAAAPGANSEWVVTTRSFIPGDFVNDFGAEAESGSQVTQGPAPMSRSFIPCNFVDDFCVVGSADL